MTERAWRPGEVRSGRLEAAARAQLEPPRRGPRDGSGGNAGNGMRGLSQPKTVTAERREASAPIARCAPRLTSAAREQGIRACRRSAIPSRGWQQDEGYPGRRKRRGSEASCGSTRIAARRNERVVAGTSGTGLFDIVNRGSAATRRLRSSGRQRLRVSRTTRATRSYPPPCGEGRPPKRSGGGRGGGRCCWTHLAQQQRPPPPTPPHKGEGSRPSLRRLCASNSKLSS